MTKLHDGFLADLFSNGLKYNPEIRALSFAVQQEKQRILDEADGTLVTAGINNLPEQILDYLAVELRTPVYDQNYNIITKRRLIAETLPFYAMAGTPAAVNRVLSAVWPYSYIEEFFDYGGEAFHFRVIAETHYSQELLDVDAIITAVEKSKRLSTVLDEVVIKSTEPIVITQTMSYITYTDIRCGLRPQTATLGVIFAPDVIVTPGLTNSVYAVPRDQHAAGMWPWDATIGRVTGDDLIITDSVQSASYTEIRDQIPTGLHPQIAESGQILGDIIQVDASTQNNLFSTMKAGLVPQTAEDGQILGDTIQVDSSAQGTIFSTLRAGQAPQTAVLGEQTANNIQAADSLYFNVYSTPRDQHAAGLDPQTAVTGEQLADQILAGDASEFSVYGTPRDQRPAGLSPQSAMLGDQAADQILAGDASEFSVYGTPRDQHPVGLLPHSDMSGGMASDQFAVSEEGRLAGIYSADRTGLSPETATQGEIFQDGAQVKTGDQVAVFTTPRGEILPGSYPQGTAAGGATSGDGLGISDTYTSTYFSGPLCGDSFTGMF